MPDSQPMSASMEVGSSIRHVVVACLFVLTVALMVAAFLGVPLFPKNDWSSLIVQDQQQATPMETLDPILSEEFKEMFKDTARAVYKAKKHVRGCKTSAYLRKSIDIMEEVLSNLDIDKEPLIERPTQKSKSICPDVFMGTTYGYPMYHKGMEIINCSYGKPVWKLVTVVNYFNQAWSNESASIEKFIGSVQKENANFNIVIALGGSVKANDMAMEHSNVHFVDTHNMSDGVAWNYAIKKADTPYVLLARGAEQLTNNSHLERHVREIESLAATATGSSTRTPDGKWRTGCFQTVYRNYTLKYFEGYDESKHECMFCDFFTGPFTAPVVKMKKFKFRNMNENEGLFEDWFLRLNQANQLSMVCPDSMFHVKYPNTKTIELDSFMKKWQLYKMTNHMQASVTTRCDKGITPSPGSGMMTPVCVLQAKADAIVNVMTVCEENNITCELADDILLAAVKMNKLLPWSEYREINIVTENLSSILNLQSAFQRHKLMVKTNNNKSYKSLAVLSSDPLLSKTTIWIRQMKRTVMSDQPSNTLNHHKPTKIMFHGHWLRVARNPGLTVKKQYGADLYRHAETQDLTALGKFTKCAIPGHHACRDRYNTDGSVQFTDVFP